MTTSPTQPSFRTAAAVRKRRILIATAAAVAVSAAAVPAVLALGSDDAAGSDASANEASLSYYTAVRQSLTPLIAHVREFPATVSGLASSDATVTPALAKSTDDWAGDYATARDLVRRLTPPRGAEGAQASRLYETGAMLYVEAARAASVAVKTPDADGRKATAAMGQRLYTLGDRMFDSAFRVLNANGALSASILRFPAAVPGDADASQVPVGPPVATSTPTPSPPALWVSDHLSALAQVADLARSAAAQRSELEAGQRLISAPLSEIGAQEAVNGLRLAVLVLAEKAPGSRDSRVPGQSERLKLMGDRVWNSALTYLDSAHAFDEKPLELAEPASEATLYTGGAFDGNPPPLNPGDPVDKGLPGGLPTLDPMSLLGRR